MKVLTVCTGNRHRSPIAAALLRAKGIEAISAGVSLKLQTSIFPPKTRAIVDKLPKPEYRSQKVTSALLRWADIVIFMQPSHLKSLLENFPVELKNNPPKIVCLADYFGPKGSLKKIPDPGFNMDIFDDVVALIKVCVDNFAAKKKSAIVT